MSDSSNSSNSAMQMEDFLQLLTSQISNQDPLEPMKDTEFISQMANIASLEQMQQFTQGFESFADSQKDMVAQAYLGKMVNISEDGSDVTDYSWTSQIEGSCWDKFHQFYLPKGLYNACNIDLNQRKIKFGQVNFSSKLYQKKLEAL